MFLVDLFGLNKHMKEDLKDNDKEYVIISHLGCFKSKSLLTTQVEKITMPDMRRKFWKES